MGEVNIDNLSEEELAQLEEDLRSGKVPEPEAATEEIPPAKEPGTTSAEEEQAKPEPTIEERLAALEEENQKLNKRVQDKENFIQVQSQEIGLLRKKASQVPDPAPVTDEELMNNPSESVAKMVQLELAKRREQDAVSKLSEEQVAVQVKERLHEWEPEFPELIEDMAAMMKNDGASDEAIANFKTKPYTTYQPIMIYQMAQRAKLVRRMAELEAENEKLRGRPKELIDKVNRASRAAPKVTSRTAKTQTEAPRLSQADIDKMSYEELEKLENQLLKR